MTPITLPFWLFVLLIILAGFTAIGILLLILLGFFTIITSLIDHSIIKKRTVILNNEKDNIEE